MELEKEFAVYLTAWPETFNSCHSQVTSPLPIPNFSVLHFKSHFKRALLKSGNGPEDAVHPIKPVGFDDLWVVAKDH